MDESERDWQEVGHAEDGGEGWVGPRNALPPGVIPEPVTFPRSLRDAVLLLGDLAPIVISPPGPWVDQALDMIRGMLGIPAGFPWWYRPELPALPVGPIGRAIQNGNWRRATLEMLLARSREFWQLPPDPFDPSPWFADDSEWRIFDERMVEIDDPELIMTCDFRSAHDAVTRALRGIPDGFPLWYVPPRPALPIGPIGRAQKKLREILDDPAVQAMITDSVL